MFEYAATLLTDFSAAATSHSTDAGRSGNEARHGAGPTAELTDELTAFVRHFHTASAHLDAPNSAEGQATAAFQRSFVEDFSPPWEVALNELGRGCGTQASQRLLSTLEAVPADDSVPNLSTYALEHLKKQRNGSDYSPKGFRHFLGTNSLAGGGSRARNRWLARLSACTLRMRLHHVRTEYGRSVPARGHISDDVSEKKIVSVLIDEVKILCSQAKTAARLPVELQQHLQAYAWLQNDGGAVVNEIKAAYTRDHDVFVRRKELCLGRDYHMDLKSATGAGGVKANRKTGVLVVFVPLYSHGAGAAPQPCPGGAHTTESHTLVAKVFSIAANILSTPGHSPEINMHGAHSEAFTHLYMLSQARGGDVDAVRERLLGDPSPQGPAAEAQSFARLEEQLPCHVPALRGVDVSPNPEASDDARSMRAALLDGKALERDSVKAWSECVKSIWVMTAHRADGTLAEVMAAVHQLQQMACLSAAHAGLFQAPAQSALGNQFTFNFGSFGSASEEWHAAPPAAAPRQDHRLMQELAGHVAVVRAHFSNTFGATLHSGRAAQDAAAERLAVLSRAVAALRRDGWPHACDGDPRDEGNWEHAFLEDNRRNVFLFWLSWRARLHIMRDIIRAVAQSHAGTLSTAKGATGAHAFCHHDISLNNVVLHDFVAYLIDWANACIKDPANKDQGVLLGCSDTQGTTHGGGRSCWRHLHHQHLSGAPELRHFKEDSEYEGTRFEASRVGSLTVQSGTSSTTLTRHRSLPFPGGDAFISPVLTAEHAQLEPLPFPLHRVSPPRDEYVPPAATTPPSRFQQHASSDVWMAGIVFCQIIRMDHLDEGHCTVANYGRTPPAGPPPPRPRAEPMAALLPQADEWWCLMPPLFSDSTGASDPAHGSWKTLWCELRAVILQTMLVHEERATASQVYHKFQGLCGRLESGGDLSRLL